MKKVLMLLSAITMVLLFTACGGGTSDTTQEVEYNDFNVGDIVYWGAYDFTNPEEINSDIEWSTPIEWIVAEYNEENGLLTLISTKILWEDGVSDMGLRDTELRTHLDDVFYNKAFTDTDRENMGYFTINDTLAEIEMNVTIPHEDTIKEIFPRAEDRLCYDLSGEVNNYWTRYKSMVDYNGDIRALAWADHFVAGIRPEVCVDKSYLDTAGSSVAPEQPEPTTAAETSEDKDIVDIVQAEFDGLSTDEMKLEKDTSFDEYEVYSVILNGEKSGVFFSPDGLGDNEDYILFGNMSTDESFKQAYMFAAACLVKGVTSIDSYSDAGEVYSELLNQAADKDPGESVSKTVDGVKFVLGYSEDAQIFFSAFPE